MTTISVKVQKMWNF